jgi:hypothetical protein
MYVVASQCPATVPKTAPGFAGLGGCGCGCGGGCQKGLGVYLPVNHPVPSSALQSTDEHSGLGLFDSMDFTTWGIAEWAAIGFGLYIVGSVLGDFGRGRARVSKAVRKRKYSAKRKAELKKELGSL